MRGRSIFGGCRDFFSVGACVIIGLSGFSRLGVGFRGLCLASCRRTPFILLSY